jgi:hypothetical protein
LVHATFSREILNKVDRTLVKIELDMGTKFIDSMGHPDIR